MSQQTKESSRTKADATDLRPTASELFSRMATSFHVVEEATAFKLLRAESSNADGNYPE